VVIRGTQKHSEKIRTHQGANRRHLGRSGAIWGDLGPSPHLLDRGRVQIHRESYLGHEHL